MAGGAKENEQMAEARSAATAAIVGSEADKKLVVAGPGTGKTYTFEQALQNVEGKGLALTFIRNLVSDLEEALGDLADVFTFHGNAPDVAGAEVAVDGDATGAGLTSHF
jgi:superfamily I DNA/RNA helicase